LGKVKHVHIIYKTHLDIGFTDLSAHVIESYVDHFIPKAIELANQVNTDEVKKFVWSVGAWIVDHYLRHTEGAKHKAMVDAIKKGYISWHGMPFTPHCEIMSEELFEFGLSIGKGLDDRFRKKTIAAKMTDVPGHTAGIIKYLAKAGIKYLHLGINDASALPDTPSTFVWKSPEGDEILVDYCQGYGGEKTLDFGEDVLYFAHSGDNLGPPTREEIETVYTSVQAKYPDAEVFGSGLSEYATSLLPFKDQFPVIEQEIADTWIHGAGTDPFKVGLFKAYLREMKKAANEGITPVEQEAFYHQMLMVAEHTWGLDFKKYLSDYVNWDKKSFQKARAWDKLSEDYAGNYPTLYEFSKNEFKKQVKNFDWEERSYSLFETSHQEQRDYLEKAILALSEAHRGRFHQIKADYLKMGILDDIPSFTQLTCKHLAFDGNQLRESEAGDHIEILDHGGIIFNGIKLGNFSYQLYGTETFERYQESYSHNMEVNYDWAMPDFYKCGFETKGAAKETQSYTPKLHESYIKDNALILHLKYEASLCDATGCPRHVFVKYVFGDQTIEVELNIVGKDAHRMPESLWITFLENNNYDNVQLKKLNSLIDPYNVVHRGNRNYHAVESVILNERETVITPLHTPLVSLGERRLYDFNQQYANHQQGVHFNIYNNLWGTNFKMWYEEDIKACFKLAFKA